jgi:hypothetical protein
MSRTIGKRSLLASLVLAGALAGCATRTRVVYVPTEPPPPVREVISVSPGAGYVWIPGHHAWDHGTYVWITGRWEIAPRPYVRWTPGRWARDSRGWFWIEGHWS